MHDPQASYDRVAEEYARRIFNELDGKPFDRALLDGFANALVGAGTVADVGCGPGHVTRYLHERNVAVCGIDISPAMVTCARRLNPGITFVQGDMLNLDIADASWAAIVAFYSIIHIPRDEVPRVFREFRRVIQPGGQVLLAFHRGDEILHLDEWWGHAVAVDFVFFQLDEMAGYLESAGFAIEETLEREPYAPDVEHQSRRCYVRARRPLQ